MLFNTIQIIIIFYKNLIETFFLLQIIVFIIKNIISRVMFLTKYINR